MTTHISLLSLDIVLDAHGVPHLLEMNGAQSGFDGLYSVTGDTGIFDTLCATLNEWAGNRPIKVVTALAYNGVLPSSYVDALIRTETYARHVENVHNGLTHGISGLIWARQRSNRSALPLLGEPTSMDVAFEREPRLQRVVWNISGEDSFLPAELFELDGRTQTLNFRNDIAGLVYPLPHDDTDIVWLRCPVPRFMPTPRGLVLTPKYPHEAYADHKLFLSNVLTPTLKRQIPAMVPIGRRISSAASIEQLLESSDAALFVCKPLLARRAGGVDLIRREEVAAYAQRLRHLEAQDETAPGLPLELQGAAELIATQTLAYDLTLLSPFITSMPVIGEATKRPHQGCVRAMAMLRQTPGQSPEVRFLGAYWFLANTPLDGEGIGWDRLIAHLSHGAFCQALQDDELPIIEGFTQQAITAFAQQTLTLPQDYATFQGTEEQFWTARYQEQTRYFQRQHAWNAFCDDIQTAKAAVEQRKQAAIEAGFLRAPDGILPRRQVSLLSIPYLIGAAQRIMDAAPKERP